MVVVQAGVGRNNRQLLPSVSDADTLSCVLLSFLTGCLSSTAEGIVKDRCHNRRTCDIDADEQTFSKLCPGIGKYLKVSFICGEYRNQLREKYLTSTAIHNPLLLPKLYEAHFHDSTCQS